ncbi:glycosyltransferase [Halorussus marinus]|uniref:glycosyltransferase n=1 Tax=Halorussus marinus TaxID=2505976 RepID=UPI001091E23F|nr:glycosyltransferase [Halorussus marinus]
MPAVSFVVPAKDEAAYLPDALASIRDQRTDREYEIVVVDGDSDDDTAAIARRYGAAVVDQRDPGIGAARHRGAQATDGEWLAFVDADTAVDPDYLDAMLAFVRKNGLAAASSRCRMPDCLRATAMAATINHVFPRLGRPILPGFNCFVRRNAYADVGGFPNVPNEDTAFSRELARRYPTGYHPEALVETSPRRVERLGLTGTLVHYLRLDWRRLRDESPRT